MFPLFARPRRTGAGHGECKKSAADFGSALAMHFASMLPTPVLTDRFEGLGSALSTDRTKPACWMRGVGFPCADAPGCGRLLPASTPASVLSMIALIARMEATNRAMVQGEHSRPCRASAMRAKEPWSDCGSCKHCAHPGVVRRVYREVRRLRPGDIIQGCWQGGNDRPAPVGPCPSPLA